MSVITSSRQGFPDFTELAEKLQTTAQALLTAGIVPSNDHARELPGRSREDPPPEIRSYRIPGFMVAEEKQMLASFKAESWQEMLNQAHDRIYAMAFLMRHFEADEEVDGFSVQLIGNALMAPLEMLSRLCSLVADFRPAGEEETET